MREILVVGGGPAGLSAAAEAAKLGAEVEVIEEDGEAGIPEHCAGLVSLKGLHLVIGTSAPVIREIRGFKVFTPSGRAYTARGNQAKAAVVDRPALEKELLRAAEKAGASVKFSTKYSGIEHCKVLLNAEGTKGAVSKRLGLQVPESIPAAQLDLETQDYEEDLVEIHLGDFAPDFFAWVVPRKGSVRVGLATRSGVPLRILEWMLEKGRLAGRFPGAKRGRPIFGKVVTGGPLRRAEAGRAIAIGDAGGFVKPTTGGGVVLGCLTARLAARAAVRFIQEGAALDSFSTEWKKAYGREFYLMKAAMRVYRRMRAEEMEALFSALEEGGVLAEITQYDMDLQGKALTRALRTRALFRLLPAILRSFL
ncbi:MAG: NAD(P)/FAD-dependent oxidoreductase [Candidatus Verstraetearchaeota archaeon]|nr:NAD(P)/FAD-dependent oxidoreductase [Candidatus Verstraetearchaeota archaeon]